MTIRRGATALLLVALAGGCGAGAAPAPPAPPPAPPAVAARSGAFVVVADSASGLARATAAPGGRAALAFRVANGSGESRTLALRAEGGWLAAPASVTVPARQSVVVEATARVPASVPPGTLLRGALVARAQGRAAPGTRASLSYESAALAVVRVGPRGGR